MSQTSKIKYLLGLVTFTDNGQRTTDGSVLRTTSVLWPIFFMAASPALVRQKSQISRQKVEFFNKRKINMKDKIVCV
jgi:hypothetical protein